MAHAWQTIKIPDQRSKSLCGNSSEEEIVFLKSSFALLAKKILWPYASGLAGCGP